MADRQGISNRESASDEAHDRQQFPPLNVDSQQAEDTAEGVEAESSEQARGRQTSRKSGSRSTAQKGDESRYTDRPQPPSRKVPGAFGSEPE